MNTQNQKGYVLLLAVLISSIILAMSLGVFAIALKEVTLSTFARDSVRAFAAASRGLECAMFYDRITTHVTLDAGMAERFYIDAPGPDRIPFRYTPFHKGNSTDFPNYMNGSNAEPETWPLTNGTPGAPLNNFVCGGYALVANSYHADHDNLATGNTFIDTHSGTSSFTVDYGDSCATVTVVKRGAVTTFSSSGFSSVCSDTNPRRTQRVIEVTVNI